jgi:hypothetical protein
MGNPMYSKSWRLAPLKARNRKNQLDRDSKMIL